MKKIKNYFYRIQWKCYKNVGFSLVELIVVVAILAILSGAAYLALSGETPAARDAKRKSDLSTIRAALESYYNKNNYYPQPAVRDAVNKKNAWGYRPNDNALASCKTSYNAEIDEINFDNTYCGGNIKDRSGNVTIGWKGTITEESAKNSVWAAGGTNRTTVMPFDSNYITNIPRDPKLSGRKSFTDTGVGDYVYAVYKGVNANSITDVGGVQYQLATTLENSSDEDSTFITGNYTRKRRGTDEDPLTLIGSANKVLMDKQVRGEPNTDIISSIAAQAGGIDGEIGLINTFITDNNQKFDSVDNAKQFRDRAIQKRDEANQIKTTTPQRARELLRLAREDLREAVNQVYIADFNNILQDVDQKLQTGLQSVASSEDITKLQSVIDYLKRAQTEYNRAIGEEGQEDKVRILMRAALQNAADVLGSMISQGTSVSDSSAGGSGGNTSAAGGTGASVNNSAAQGITANISKLKQDITNKISELGDSTKSLLVINASLTNLIKDTELIIGDIETVERRTVTEEDVRAVLNEAQRENAGGRYRVALEKVLQARNMINPSASTSILLNYNEEELTTSESEDGYVFNPSNTSEYSGIPYPLDL